MDLAISPTLNKPLVGKESYVPILLPPSSMKINIHRRKVQTTDLLRPQRDRVWFVRSTVDDPLTRPCGLLSRRHHAHRHMHVTLTGRPSIRRPCNTARQTGEILGNDHIDGSPVLRAHRRGDVAGPTFRTC